MYAKLLDFSHLQYLGPAHVVTALHITLLRACFQQKVSQSIMHTTHIHTHIYTHTKVQITEYHQYRIPSYTLLFCSFIQNPPRQLSCLSVCLSLSLYLSLSVSLSLSLSISLSYTHTYTYIYLHT